MSIVELYVVVWYKIDPFKLYIVIILFKKLSGNLIFNSVENGFGEIAIDVAAVISFDDKTKSHVVVESIWT